MSSHTPKPPEQELTWIDDHVDGRPYGADLVVPEKSSAFTSSSRTVPKTEHHCGEVATMVLVPEVIDAMAPVKRVLKAA